MDQGCQFAIIVSMPGDAGGLGALEDALLLLLLPLVLGCSRDPTQALSTADSPLLRVALLLSATGSLACACHPTHLNILLHAGASTTLISSITSADAYGKHPLIP